MNQKINNKEEKLPYAYYKRLKPFQKKIYEKSDQISYVNLPRVDLFQSVLKEMVEALATGNQIKTEEKVQQFLTYLCHLFGIPPVKAKVLERRPSKNWGELHGLYQCDSRRGLYLITVWMRTAKRVQVVAFRSFLRTVLHEALHHLDYTYFKLGDSFHTEGFYKRESSLFRQLIGESS